jgi:hypothetical protein
MADPPGVLLPVTGPQFREPICHKMVPSAVFMCDRDEDMDPRRSS